MSAEAASTRGRAGSLAVLTLALSLFVFWPTLVTLFDAWQRVHDYQHGYLVAAIAAVWLGLVARRAWSDAARPSLSGAGLLAAALLVWLIGLNANSQVVHQVIFPVALWSAVFAATGWRVARHMIAPIAFLYFAIPVWEYLLPALQRMSVAATETILALLSVPAQVREFSVTIPEGTFEIIEGCSGKRYFVSTAAMAVLAGLVGRLRPMRFVGLVAASCALALVANWLRIVVVIYAGHATNMQHYFVAVEHTSLGNVIFGLLIIAVVLLSRTFAGSPVPVTKTETGQIAAPHAGVRSSPRWAAVPLSLLVVTLIATQVRANAKLETAALGDLPVATTTWQGPLPPGAVWMPDYLEPDAQRRAAYISPAGTVEVYANAYAAQHQGRELILYRNTLLAPGTWHRPWPPIETIVTSGSRPLAMFEAQSGDDVWVVAYAYEIGGWPTTSEPLAQLAYGLKSFLSPVPSGVVALASRCDENCEAARALITSFWDDMCARILALIPDQPTNR